ncbi:MAG: hypothetical protein J6X55_08090 [Victivallales bacterium]|nr:hypothetical protein [Victivallales bacterium]
MDIIKHSLERAGQTWKGWHKGEFQIHFIHTGVGEGIFLIFPDGTTMLLDCGDQPSVTRMELAVPVVPSPERLAGEWIARYILRALPHAFPLRNERPLIDYMLLTHYHDDHSGTPIWQSIYPGRKGVPNCNRSGFGLAAETLAFDTAIDRAWPEYNDPRDDVQKNLEVDHMKRLYKALQERDGLHVEKFRLGTTDQIVQRYRPSDYADFKVTNITCNGRILCKDGSIRDLYAERVKMPERLNENGMSLGMIFRYGKFSFYTAGDFSDIIPDAEGNPIQTEDILAKELSPVDVAKINHHGHCSMPEGIIKALAAHAWIACVWDQLHTLDFVMERLSDRNLYPDPRVHFPTVFPKERCEADGNKPFFKDIAPETFNLGAHVVVTVPSGGETYRISCLRASDESMTILGEYDFESRG